MPRYDENGRIIPGTENEEYDDEELDQDENSMDNVSYNSYVDNDDNEDDNNNEDEEELQEDNDEKEIDDDQYTVVDTGFTELHPKNLNNEQEDNQEIEFGNNKEIELDLDNDVLEDISNQLDNQVDKEIEDNTIHYPTYDEQLEVTDGTQDTLTVFDENTINNFSVDFEEKPVGSINYVQYNKTHPFYGAKTPERRNNDTVLALTNALDLMPLKNLGERLSVDQFFYDFDRTKPGHEAAKQLSKMMDTYAFLGQLLNTNYAELSTTRLIQINQTVNTLLGMNGKDGISELISQFDRATDFEYADNDAVKAMHDVAAKLDQIAAVLKQGATADYNLNAQEKLNAENELHQAIEAQNKNIDDLNRVLLVGGVTTPFDEMESEYKLASKQEKDAKIDLENDRKELNEAEEFFKSNEYKTWEIQAKRVQQMQDEMPRLEAAAKNYDSIINETRPIMDSIDKMQKNAEAKAKDAKEKLDNFTKECKEKETKLLQKISPAAQKDIKTRTVYSDYLSSIRDVKALNDKYVDALVDPSQKDKLLNDSNNSRRTFSKACMEFVNLYNKEHGGLFNKTPGKDVLKKALGDYKNTKDIAALQNILTAPIKKEFNECLTRISNLSNNEQLFITDYDECCNENNKLIRKKTSEYDHLVTENDNLKNASKEQHDIVDKNTRLKNDATTKFNNYKEQLDKIQNSWSTELIDKIRDNKKITATYPGIIENKDVEVAKLSLKRLALEQGKNLVVKIKEGGQFAREKYEKFMSIKHIKEFNDTNFDDIHAKLEAFNARIADKKGSHKNSPEYTAMTDALTKALGSTADNLSENLKELERKSQAYLDAKRSQFFVIGSKLRHVRLSFAEEMKGFANQYSKLYTESKPTQISDEQLNQLSIEESAKPNIKGLSDVKVPTKQQVETAMEKLRADVLKKHNANKKDVSKDLKKDEQIVKNDNPAVNVKGF